MTTTLDLPALADRYANVAEDLHQAAAAFKDGAQAIRKQRLKLAEDAIRSGLDRLDKVIEEMPKSE